MFPSFCIQSHTDDGMHSPVSLPGFHALLEQLYRRPSSGSPTSPTAASPSTSTSMHRGRERETDLYSERGRASTRTSGRSSSRTANVSSSGDTRASRTSSTSDLQSSLDARDSLVRRASEEDGGRMDREWDGETRIRPWLEDTSSHFSRGRRSETGEASSGARLSRSSTPTPVASASTSGRDESSSSRIRGRSFPSSRTHREASSSVTSVTESEHRRRLRLLHENDRDMDVSRGSSSPTPSSQREGNRRTSSVTPPDLRQPQQHQQGDGDIHHSQNQVIPRGRLHTMLLEVGGLGAALSEDSMRKLRYVLSWLQYATAHIDAQILVLRDFIASLQQHYLEYPPGSPTTPTSTQTRPGGTGSHKGRHERRTSENTTISADHHHRLIDIRRNVVRTVKEVVAVISTHVGGANLPEPANRAVKSFIMKLPRNSSARAGPDGLGLPPAASLGAVGESSSHGAGRGSATTAAAASGHAGRGQHVHSRHRDRGVGGSSATNSPQSSRAASPSTSRTLREDDAMGAGGQVMSAGAAYVAAQRILVLATESLEMMRGVNRVVMDSLDRADAWVERLRHVGLQRGEVQGQAQPGQEPGAARRPLPGDDDQYRNERDRVDYRDPREADLLSPLNISRRGSVSSSAGSVYEYASPSLNHRTRSTAVSPVPSSSYGAGAGYHPSGAPVDTPSPDMGRVMRRMSLGNENGRDEDIKREDEDERDARMEVDS
ncbi:hypothetical protein K435DRAFT_141785 [Dendrothele bispora CBS 962.96]|uniref:Opi1-domain-containing protein n=1 Tax=Dendrothele bispora (strain CBS 962.96) TaxID=1314807 RepID=A0A4V4HFH9_DENBC|nr:hypothetical protein K435DRAFT_141785 [Dendrothele bispora CBS 962.96]